MNSHMPCLLLTITFHLWQKENLDKHQKVSKYYGHDCTHINYLMVALKNIATKKGVKKRSTKGSFLKLKKIIIRR